MGSNGAEKQAAVVLVNVGTPEAPETREVRSFLAEFLSDERIRALPRPLWKLLLYGIILPFRAPHSAEKYRAIWTPEGSPLLVHTEAQARLLEQELERRGIEVAGVYCAMRYGKPSFRALLRQLLPTARLVVIPLFPQFSLATTQSVRDVLEEGLAGAEDEVKPVFVDPFFRRNKYIEALALRIEAHWREKGRGGKLVLSFHGLPESAVDSESYREQCIETAKALQLRLNLDEPDVVVCFQSRMGKARWTGPYTDDVLRVLAAEGTARVDVFCPGFVCDCLETIEEVDRGYRKLFLSRGGREFYYIPALNEHPKFIELLADLAQEALTIIGAGHVQHIGQSRFQERPPTARC